MTRQAGRGALGLAALVVLLVHSHISRSSPWHPQLCRLRRRSADALWPRRSTTACEAAAATRLPGLIRLHPTSSPEPTTPLSLIAPCAVRWA